MGARQTDFSHFQEGAARLRRAMNGLADRVPVFGQLHEFAAEHLAIPRREFFVRPDLSVPALLQTQQDFDIDVASITFEFLIL